MRDRIIRKKMQKVVPKTRVQIRMLGIMTLGLVLAVLADSGTAYATEALTPLQQTQNGVQASEVTCAGERVLMTTPSGMPACVFAESTETLLERGFALVIRPPAVVPETVADPSLTGMTGMAGDMVNAVIVISPGSHVSVCEETSECYFVPRVITIGVGDTVVWKNMDETAHGVAGMVQTEDGLAAAFGFHGLMPGAEFSHRFEAAGVYEYAGIPGPWMKGTIIVE